MMIGCLDGFANILIALGYKYLKDWKYWYLINDIEAFILLWLLIFLIPESPRYYISRGDFPRARAVFARIAKCNRKPMFSEPLEGELEERRLLDNSQTTFEHISSRPSYPIRPKQSKLAELCRRSSYDRLLMATVLFLWFSVDIVFYGIGFGINELGGDLYTNGFILGISDICSTFAVAILVTVIGRKRSLFLTWGASAVGCIVYNFVHNNTIAGYFFVLIGRFGGTGTFQLMYLYTSEAFPS